MIKKLTNKVKEENRENVKVGLTIAGVVGFIWAINLGPKYEIDGNRVKDKFFSMYDKTLVEYKEGGKIRYGGYTGDRDELSVIKINGRRYDSDNTTIYPEGQERYFYLLKEIENEKAKESELRAQKSLERKMKKEKKRMNKLNRDLEILRK